LGPNSRGLQQLSPAARRTLQAVGIAGVVAIAFHLAHGQLGLGGSSLDSFTNDWLYDTVVAGAAISCLARGLVIRVRRLPWLLLGIGLAFNATGEIYYSLAFGDSGNPPIPSLDDLFYLLFYPAVYAAFVLLIRERIGSFSASTWLDGGIAALTSAAVIAAIAFEPILHSATHGNAASLATTLAYPVGDMLLLGIAVGMFALSGWRPGRGWLLLGLGLGLSAIADTAYAYAMANGTYVVGGVLDSLWLAAALFIGASAWQRPPRLDPTRFDGSRLLVIPGALAIVALGVLLYGGFHHVGAVGLSLAGAALLLVIVRAVSTFRENLALLESSRHDAMTDSLTGLGNRRMVQAALERALADGPDSPPAMFAMFDLDGFKAYNDHFGHLAGDTLLAHLGQRLQSAVAGAGTAYRLGGDEFCILLDAGLPGNDVRLTAALTALSAKGEGFTVGASYGTVSLPFEALSPTQAMRVADDRMYARKGDRVSAGKQSHDVLLELLRERQPELHEHLRQVGQLAVMTGRRFGMNTEQLDELRRGAELHDIGKAAVPDAILEKPGALSEHEWTFMRRHTLIGERILSAAPALGPIALLVRSSHERWDGSGYPDGLAGRQIPLAARIVFVCDAFDAMTSERSYGRAMAPERALQELRRGAGTQFDPAVVEAFALAWAEGFPAQDWTTGEITGATRTE
jgi:diguanylate cyclase (GGDEF)-like protein